MKRNGNKDTTTNLTERETFYPQGVRTSDGVRTVKGEEK